MRLCVLLVSFLCLCVCWATVCLVAGSQAVADCGEWFCLAPLFVVVFDRFCVEVTHIACARVMLSVWHMRWSAWLCRREFGVGCARQTFVSGFIDGMLVHVNYVADGTSTEGAEIVVLGVSVANETNRACVFDPESVHLFSAHGGRVGSVGVARYDSLCRLTLQSGEIVSGTLCFAYCEPSRLEFIATNRRLVRLVLA